MKRLRVLVVTVASTGCAFLGSPRGAGGDGNDGFKSAVDMIMGESIEAELDPLKTDADYYRVEGTPGAALFVFTDAKPDDDPFSPAFPDLVITIHGQDEEQIAQNDDPMPRVTHDSSLPIRLPLDGVAFIKVEEFCVSALATEAGCTATHFDEITSSHYSVAAFALDFGLPGNVEESEPNNDAGTATALTYGPIPGSPGSYYTTLVSGTFASLGDIDSYRVNLPPDFDVGTGSALVTALACPAGIEGDGGTSSVGVLTLWDAAGVTKIAEVDAAGGGDLEVPATLATEYLLTAQHGGAQAGGNDYYFLKHYPAGISNDPEVEANNTYLTATALTGAPNDNAGNNFYCRGTLTPGSDTLDHFSFTAIAGESASVYCSAQRAGSGLRGMQFRLMNAADGQDITGGASGAETTTADLRLLDVGLGGVTNVVLQVTAASQDSAVTSNFYQCGIHTSSSP